LHPLTIVADKKAARVAKRGRLFYAQGVRVSAYKSLMCME